MRLLLLLISFACVCCSSDINSPGKTDSVLADAKDTIIPDSWQPDIHLCDTITGSGNFIHHISDTAGNNFVVWGTNAGVIDTMNDEYTATENNCTLLSGENDQYLALISYGKGLPLVWFLPLSKHDTILHFTNVVSFDMKYNLMLTEQEDKFVLQNFTSGRKQSFPLASVVRITYSIPVFDSISFQKDGVYLEWKDENEASHSSTQRL